MKELTVGQLHQLRLQIFDNAESLHKEAKLLLDHGYYARAYLLAYFSCEELGKLPIIVGAVGCLESGATVDWKKVMRRFRDHKAKVDSDDMHQYMFGVDLDLVSNSDLEWLVDARKKSAGRVALKNKSTYVDVQDGRMVLPLNEIDVNHATKMLERAFESLRAHWKAETLVNPVLFSVLDELEGR
jgi:AbiV family abortive infection protein